MPKHGLVVIAIILTLISTVGLQTIKITNLEAEKHELVITNEYVVQTLKKEQEQFKATVDKLQGELAQYTLDAKAYECAVACKAKVIDNKAKEEESKIRNELQSDSSSDNQLDIARRMLDEFNRNQTK